MPIKFLGNRNNVKFPEHTQKLFDAIMANKVIKSVTFRRGNSSTKIAIIHNVIPQEYTQGMCQNNGVDRDYVNCKFLSDYGGNGFYMDWVMSFEL